MSVVLVSFRWWVVTSSLSTWVATEVGEAEGTYLPSPQPMALGVGEGDSDYRTCAPEGPIGTSEVQAHWRGQGVQHTHPRTGLLRDEVTGLEPEVHAAVVVQLHT